MNKEEYDDRKLLEEISSVEDELDSRRSDLDWFKSGGPVRSYRFIALLCVIGSGLGLIGGLIAGNGNDVEGAFSFLISAGFLYLLLTLVVKGRLKSVRNRISFLKEKKRELQEMRKSGD